MAFLRILLASFTLCCGSACSDPAHGAPPSTPLPPPDAGHPPPRDAHADCCTAGDGDGGDHPLDPAENLDGGPDGGEPGADSLTVLTANGSLEGVRELSTRVFRGIAYAAPPVGPLRFAPPAPPSAWQGVREAHDFGASCMQGDDATLRPFSEDCLTLNVYAPDRTATPLPVMVFFHGGGLAAGGSRHFPSQWLSEGAQVIVVTVNYRLGRLGFLAHPKLDADLNTTSGNMGLRDQQAALRWVQANISAFGGAPDKVTIFGQSAGSVSVCHHLFAAGSEGLTARFLMESGSCVAGPFAPLSRERAFKEGAALADQLCPGSADPVACLRGLPAGDLVPNGLVDSWDDATAVPYVDGTLLSEAPLTLLRQGKFHAGPVLMGTNANEAAMWALYGMLPLDSRTAMRFWLYVRNPGASDLLMEHYEPSSDAEARDAWIRALTDHDFRCPTRVLARGLRDHGAQVYLYRFDVTPAAHSQELDYVFGWPMGGVSSTLKGAPEPPIRSVSQTVQGFWGAFAHTGDPNGDALPKWPAYAADPERHMVLAEETQASADSAAADCDWFDATFVPKP